MPDAAASDPLCRALSAVARAAGISVLAAESAGSDHERLEAIARASRIRIRQVSLTGRWWRRDAGPLLGFVHETNRPVALLPSGTTYEVFDPAGSTRTRVESAPPLTSTAYMLYRPLPDLVSGPLDMLRFAVQGHARDLWVAMLTAAAATLLGMLTPLATAVIINTAIPDGNRTLVLQIALGLAAAMFGRVVFELCQGIALLRLEARSSADVQAALWDRLLRLGPRFFRGYTVGDLHARAAAVSEARARLSAITIRTLFLGVLGALNLGLMFYYSARLAIVAIGATAVFVAATAACGTAAYRCIAQLQALRGRVVGLTVQLINGVARLRVAAAERLAFASWADQYHDQQVLASRVQHLGDTITVLNDLLPVLATTLIFWFAARGLEWTADGHALNAGVFLAFLAAFNIFLAGASALSMSAIELLGVTSIWSRARPILEASVEADARKAAPGTLQGGLALRDVTFRYRGDGPATLDGVSIEAPPGSFIALVGPTGSGKSTVLRLLLGFERPESGTVSFDGRDLADLELRAVRRQLGVVLQNSNIMAGSIFDNIGGAGTITLEHAWAAARAAALDNDIEQMPMGLYTFISEGGTNLSVGQRQRLLIARALASSPRILLFDEATSALDNVTQAIVQQSLEQISITRLVIAHRLSTIRRADRIYVLQHGRVVQEGTFDELARHDGLFVRLMAGQML